MADTDNDSAAEKARRPAAYWLDRIKNYQSAFQAWEDRCHKVDDLYTRRTRNEVADREYAIFWANIEVLKPASYARPPVPVVVPRFKDGNPVAREASEMMERCCLVSFEHGDINGVLERVRDDFLLYGRGTAWVRSDGEQLFYDYVNYRDFAHADARIWREVTWVARRVWMTREAGLARFGKAFSPVTTRKQDDDQTQNENAVPLAPVWEIWDREDQSVVWVAEGAEQPLDQSEPLFALRGFFPCPPPAFGTLNPDGMIPVPEIVQYKDQIEEINEYTARISAVSQSLRMKGFYAAGNSDLKGAIEAAMQNVDDRAILVPISSFAALGGQGLKDSIVWVPIAEAVALVKTLVELRRVVIEDVYQITGISDIVRGQSEASETLGAQQLKSQWGSMRIRERQKELARFSRDMTRISAEIMAETFDPANLAMMSQASLPSAEQKAQAEYMAKMAAQQQQPVPKQLQAVLKKPTMEEVVAFLRNDKMRGVVIEVETDSTIQPDEMAEKQRRIEFVTSVGGMFQQAAPMVMQAPILGPFVVEVMKFAASGFRAGRPLEQSLDDLGSQIEGMAEAAAQPKPQQEDPKVAIEKAKLELQAHTDQQRLQFEQQKHQQDMEFSREKHNAEMAMKAQDMRVEHAMAVQDAHLKQQNTEADMHMRGMADERKYADAERARQFGAEREDAKAEHDDAALMEAIEAVRAEIAAMREQIGLPILNALNGSGSTALHGRV